jgi:hypothetical protein
MKPMELYTLRVYSRGDGVAPIAPPSQPLMLERSVHAIEGVAGELLGNYAVDARSPALVVIATERERGGMGGAFWSADEQSAAVIVGISIDLQEPRPVHGYRIEWERRP